MTEPVFFAASRRFRVAEIAALTMAELETPESSDVEIARLGTVDEGGDETLIFVESKRKIAQLTTVSAAALFCRREVIKHVPAGIAILVTNTPQQAFTMIARLLFPSAARLAPLTGETGVSAHAHIAADADIEAGAIIEAGAMVGQGAAVGRGSVIGPSAVIGPSCRIGRDCFIGHGATVQYALIGNRVILHPGTRIGQDGFGYLPGENGLQKIPQLGRVIIQDDVEIGANTTVDRGALSDTIIGEGSKIDNLVQIAHNVKIGRGCVVAGHCGLSGSVTLGDFAMLGGGVGIADHVKIGRGAKLAAGSGVMKDIPAGERWAGMPAKPYREAFREFVTIRELLKKGGAKRADE